LNPRTCHHCGLPVPPGIEITAAAEEKSLFFCCHGCATAYRIISGAGLDDFYQRRDWQDAGLSNAEFVSRYDEASLTPYVEPRGEVAALTFLVEGIRCATCVWLNEKILCDLPGVTEARLNYGTHRARVVFDPRTTSPERLFAAVARLGYNPRPYSHSNLAASRKREWHDLLIRFGTAFFLSMQLMGYSVALYAGFFQGIDAQTRQIIQYFAAAATTPVVFYAGFPFLRGALRSLRNRAPDMDLLVALGVLAAYFASLHAMLTGGEVYFDTAAMIVTLVLAGRLFESSARHRAASGIDRLLQLAPENALRLRADLTESVPSSSLVCDDRVLVRPGDRFPADGVIVAGSSDIDTSAASGEPLPVTGTPGDPVLSGTLNLTFPLQVRVTAPASASFMARVARLVEEAQNRKAPVQRLADRIAGVFVPIVLLTSAAAAAFWSWRADDSISPLLAAVAVLVVACPCALGLATPTAILVASGNAASRGILFRGGDVLETAARVDRVAFDKTGTLTTGHPEICAITPRALDDNELLRQLATLEQGSRHPLASGILDAASSRGLPLGPLPAAEELPGLGLAAEVDGVHYLAGNALLLGKHGIAVAEQEDPPGTPVYLARDRVWLGTVYLSDPVRRGAREAIGALGALGIAPLLLTGDIPARAAHVAAQAGIEQVASELTPQDKARHISTLQAQGAVVLMAGDGINDAPALTTADIGCALSGGADIALDSSDLVLTRAELPRLAEAITIARRTLVVIRQNLFWAFAYNVLALPLAFSGTLYPIHAAAAMALSSICVVANSLRLGRAFRAT